MIHGRDPVLESILIHCKGKEYLAEACRKRVNVQVTDSRLQWRYLPRISYEFADKQKFGTQTMRVVLEKKMGVLEISRNNSRRDFL